jgi:hypothetical protein
MYPSSQWSGTILGSFVSRRKRNRLKFAAFDLGFMETPPKLPAVPLSELVSVTQAATIVMPQSEPWQVSTFELTALASVVAARQPKHVFEFGTFDGRSTRNIHLNAPDDAEITTLDLPPDEQNLWGGKSAGFLINDLIESGRIRMLHANSMTYDFEPFRGAMDFIFVDGGHSYECVSSDTRNALSMIEGRSSATIVWHDYGFLGDVTRAVDEVIPQFPDANQFCRIDGTSLACLIRG